MCCNVEDVESTAHLTRAEGATTHLAACSTLTTSRHSVSVVSLLEAWDANVSACATGRVGPYYRADFPVLDDTKQRSNNAKLHMTVSLLTAPLTAPDRPTMIGRRVESLPK